MAGLVLKLPTGDRIVLNGAVVENAGRGARLRILTPDTQLLRLRDAIDPAEANTPVGRIAHAVQLLLVGEGDRDLVLPQILGALDPLGRAFTDPSDRDRVDRIRALLSEGQIYQALRQIMPLRHREAELLGRLVQ